MNHWLLVGSLGFLMWSSATSVFRASPDRLEKWFLATVGTVLLLAFVSLGLTRLGVYSLPAAAGSCFGLGLVLQAIYRRRGTHDGAEPDWTPRGVVPLLVVLALFALYESHPTYNLLGGRDPGLYATFAVHIARTGGLDLDLRFMSRVAREYGDLVELWYPGIYSEYLRHVSPDPGQLVPQFMHLFPALAANGFAAFGLEGLVRVNSLVFALGIWSVFMVARRLVPFGWALAAAVAFGVNAAAIWSARNTMSEPLSVLLLFFAIHVIFSSDDRESTPIALVGGLLLGAGVLCRVDAGMAGLVVVGNSLASLVREEGARRRARWVAGGFLIASSVGWLDGYLHSHPYFYDLWRLGILEKLLLFTYGTGVVALGLASLPGSWLARRERVQTGLTMVTGLGVGLLVAWLGYAWVVRAPSAQSFVERAILELAWYVTPLAYILCCAGMAVVVWKRLWDRWLLLFCLAGGTLFVFTYNPAISPDHIWATRRWVAQVIPSLLLFSTAALWFLAEAAPLWRRWLAVGVTAVALGWYAASTWRIASVFLFESMLDGITGDYERVVEAVERADGPRVVLTDTWDVASILTYVYGVPTVRLKAPLNGESAAILDGLTLVSTGGNCTWMDPVARVRLGGQFLEIREGGRPGRLVHRIHDLRVGTVRSGTSSGSFPRVFRGNELPTKGGLRNKKRRTVRLKGEAIQSGPDMDLVRGSYEARWFGRVVESGKARVDVTAENGERTLAQEDVTLTRGPSPTYLASLPFTLPLDLEGVEIRLEAREGADVILERLEVDLHPTAEDEGPAPAEEP